LTPHGIKTPNRVLGNQYTQCTRFCLNAIFPTSRRFCQVLRAYGARLSLTAVSTKQLGGTGMLGTNADSSCQTGTGGKRKYDCYHHRGSKRVGCVVLTSALRTNMALDYPSPVKLEGMSPAAATRGVIRNVSSSGGQGRPPSNNPCAPSDRTLPCGIIVTCRASAFGRGDPDAPDLALPTSLGEAGRGRAVSPIAFQVLRSNGTPRWRRIVRSPAGCRRAVGELLHASYCHLFVQS
jgi:hypothetical protein